MFSCLQFLTETVSAQGTVHLDLDLKLILNFQLVLSFKFPQRSLAFNQTEGNFLCTNIGNWFTWREEYNEWLHKAVPYNNFGRGPSEGEKLGNFT